MLLFASEKLDDNHYLLTGWQINHINLKWSTSVGMQVRKRKNIFFGIKKTKTLIRKIWWHSFLFDNMKMNYIKLEWFAGVGMKVWKDLRRGGHIIPFFFGDSSFQSIFMFYGFLTEGKEKNKWLQRINRSNKILLR